WHFVPPEFLTAKPNAVTPRQAARNSFRLKSPPECSVFFWSAPGDKVSDYAEKESTAGLDF
ncbi:MAG: hypothetical protein JXQ83_08935, partial [Candidatus Glassbacteria bacterium]|nr:hypothetical protein [Candidatus Glassbacteria bacterium]